MRKILLLSILMSFGIVGYSQKIVSVSNPLEEYFQKNYDSTIFFIGLIVLDHSYTSYQRKEINFTITHTIILLLKI